MSKITVRAQYAEHSEGTKFYGAILVSHENSSYVIKVHGPMGAKGRVIHEPYAGNFDKGVTEYGKIIRSKTTRGYLFREVLHETHDYTKTATIESDLHSLANMICRSFKFSTDGSGYSVEMLTALGEVTKYASEEEDEPLLKEPYKAGPKVEPTRTQEWGSW
jgi:hypothetical protein